jgi:hypothetical protein
MSPLLPVAHPCPLVSRPREKVPQISFVAGLKFKSTMAICSDWFAVAGAR